MKSTKLSTIRILNNRMARIGQGLLGKLAGNRKLRFKIRLEGRKLIITPTLKAPGWPVVYYADAAQSPTVSLVPLLKLYALPDTYFPVGEFEATVNRQGWIIVDFDHKGGN